MCRFLRRSKGLIREVQREIQEAQLPERQVVHLRAQGRARGAVLFSYIIGGFFLGPDKQIPHQHTNIWQSQRMAQTFAELGYDVDVIHWTNNQFRPEKDYAFFVDVRHNMERLSPLLNHTCVKIMHLDTAHILFHNAAEATRLLALQQRRNITLKPQRFEMPNLGIEYADYATATGNDFVTGTFQYAKKMIFKVPSPCAVSFGKLTRSWDFCRRRFLWFSSSGLVHKGLDLALEAFCEIPNCQLTICAPIDEDKEFVRAYRRELYETSNIKTIGWIDIKSREFHDIASSCIAMIHLSCSEGGAPSIKTCMHAGLIPIVSRESGVDVNDFGFCLMDCSIESVKSIVSKVSKLPDEELDRRTSRARDFASRNYTRENFSIKYKNVITEIIKTSSA